MKAKTEDHKKAKLPVYKSKSPRRDTSHDEGEVGNEAEEDTYARPAPNALVVADKLSKFKSIDLAKIRTLFGRKARSNSPNNKVNITCQQVFKSRIGSSRNSPNKAVNTSHGIKMRQRSQPRKDTDPKQDLKERNGPQRGNILEPEKLELIKTIAQRKHKLNKDLWEAAELGDLPRITRLLRP